MLIGKTSALTMNIAGVIKDWMLIFFSFYLFHAPVTALNLGGYAFCCSGEHSAQEAPSYSCEVQYRLLTGVHQRSNIEPRTLALGSFHLRRRV